LALSRHASGASEPEVPAGELKMQPAKIRKAVESAESFIRGAKSLLKASFVVEGTYRHEYIRTGKLSGAVRRQSMNLTRALAEMRKP